MKRTSYAGSLTEADLGRHVTVAGWVQARRDMGGVIFVDLRDRSGTLQLVLNAMLLPAKDFSLAEHLKSQSVVAASGTLRLRDEETYNPKLATGTIELACEGLELISAAQELPFNPDDDAVREELRLKYRFLDLRRPAMLGNLRYRHQVARAVRAYLDGDGFIEVETPMLTKSTPEGARDYLVPSRVHPGSFYALPQSPQIFKQLLMVAGVDKYYQVARCFRDEDLRADRQPEFTQVDMELSFVDQEDILQHLERLFAHIFRQVKGQELTLPFPRITWKQAMDQYGSDKPDIRF
ncbi:MAG: aspartate--tRNA ligase, partial [Christensenellaceae bacterium]